jgi:hypothetical protein
LLPLAAVIGAFAVGGCAYQLGSVASHRFGVALRRGSSNPTLCCWADGPARKLKAEFMGDA